MNRADALIIDMRREEEYRAAHVKGAENISYQEIEEGYAFPKDKILVLYCERGGSSLKAAKLLGAKGY
ncbi:rhodanese-like domain-containing protein, partial [Acinetobacter soli]|uniref:rhodanese-like domain-containing protein n=1 Tax=Acinetobacter soli TaxID=487316 RepID=UPI002812AD29